MNSALLIIGLFFLAALVLGISARAGKDMDLEEWTVGGRSLGSIFVFLLLAGEIYTTFTFLGGSSWAYSKGAPAMFILAYGCFSYVISYWLLPPIWRYGKKHGLVSQSDFFSTKYNSPALGVLVAVVGLVAMMPYLVLQFKGLKLIVETASYGAISGTAAVWIGAVVVTLYVVASGLRGSAWTAALKDVMILGVVLFLGIYLPIHYYGGFDPMFHHVEAVKPGFLALPKDGKNPVWFVSTVCLTMLGFYMWPHFFASVFSGRDARVFRRNAVVLPIYQLMLLFVFFIGFAAIGQIPHLANDDLALLQISIQTFPPWVLGLIGAAGLLAALVPGSMLTMTMATVVARNFYQTFNPSADDRQIASLAKWLVPVVSLIAVYFTLAGGRGIVALLLLAYSFVTQLFPSLLLSVLPRNFGTKYGAAAGIIVGVATVVYTNVTHTTLTQLLPFLPASLSTVNTGIVALVANIVALVVVSVLTRPLLKESDTQTT
ncbi:MAG: sodium:solute symporter family protein [Salinisphaera sp.]|jgi:SSS family solute:Na+ symporter|nr:sodium:solute symporter family protein [Salinisphaera sp.]